MSEIEKKDLDEIEFVSLKELLLPDNDEVRQIEGIYGKEVEYFDFLGPIEFFIANYGLSNKSLKDKDLIMILRNIRDNLDKNLDFFKKDLEKQIMCTISASLQMQRKITKHELRLVIKHILWAIDNRNWIESKRAYIDWIANFFHLLNKEEKKKFDEEYDNLGKEHGISKEKLKLMKNEDSDYEPPLSEIILSKIDSEYFDKRKKDNDI
ncbi:MAG: hypothetical protein AABX11_05930 [Nanoarchaeota archaeon]